MTLLSLASKQIWPQVLSVAHLRPTKLVLLHSNHDNESRLPAQRLKKFFERSASIIPVQVDREEVPHDDFTALERRLDEVATKTGVNLGEAVLNFTGGNKLMATAAFRWAAKRGVRAFYLEWGNVAFSFTPRDGEMQTRSERLDGHLTDGLDCVDLLRCQIDSSEVERTGQRVTLNEKGKKMSLDEFNRFHAAGTSLENCLDITGEADKEKKKGDALELNAAAFILKLGVPAVQRSLRLKVKSSSGISSRNPHAEIDLLFNWGGRLWLVDCKDQKSADDLMDGLEKALPKGLSSNASDLLARVRQTFRMSHTKALKEDLLSVRETGGLLGQVVCIRKSEMSEEVLQFAKHNRIEIISKKELRVRLHALLFPTEKASATDLKG